MCYERVIYKVGWDFFNLELKFRNDTIISVRNRHKNSIKLKDGFQNFWAEVPSNGDHMYLITFIDNFSQKSWDYFLKQKANACKNFKILKFMSKNKMGTPSKFWE